MDKLENEEVLRWISDEKITEEERRKKWIGRNEDVIRHNKYIVTALTRRKEENAEERKSGETDRVLSGRRWKDGSYQELKILRLIRNSEDIEVGSSIIFNWRKM